MNRNKIDVRKVYRDFFDEMQDMEEKAHISEQEDETLEEDYIDDIDDKDKPDVFLPAIGCTSVHDMRPELVIDKKFIKPYIMEIEVRLTEESYMICYALTLDKELIMLCRWGYILDFVWNGLEKDFEDGSDEIKPHFRKKYPKISDLYGIKVDENEDPCPDPYIATNSFAGKQEEWWLATRITGITEDDFFDIYNNGFDSYESVLFAIDNMRKACIDMYNEINRSDAKKPKELMHSYFGNLRLRKADLVEIIFED